jgi:glycerophosphoryl diester phosphodiesterase
LATVDRTLALVPDVIVEIDVQQSADGVLILFHDDRLDRKTSGAGAVQAAPWSQLAALRLRDGSGATTDMGIPTLGEALDLLMRRGAVAQLDIKRGVDFAAVVTAVRRAGAERHVILITYNDADALTVARLAPELMLSATLRRAGDAEALIAGGVRRDRLLGWTGTRAPDPALFAALRGAGIEPIFGTLGDGPDSLDQQWLADGDTSEFRQLEADGAVLVATDRAPEVAAALGPVSCRR